MSAASRFPQTGPQAYRLRLPGPTQVPETVRQAAAKPVLAHRGGEFRAVLQDVNQKLKPLFGTENDIFLFAASGSGVMEAALANIIGHSTDLLVVSHGQFGERFAGIAKAFGANADIVATPWGQDVDIGEVRERLSRKHYQAVVAVHNESSTGIVADLSALGELVRDSDTLLVVDSVSGLGGIEVRQDEWGVDILISASQKALMCPPGLGMASISRKAWDAIGKNRDARAFYWSFLRARDAWQKGETCFTPAVSMVMCLQEALNLIHAEGVANVYARHRRLSAALRAGGNAMGLPDFGSGLRKSNTVVVFKSPDSVDAASIVREMYQRHRTVIAGARNSLAGKVVRLGTMGAVDMETVLTDVIYLEDVLRRLGQDVAPGAGLAAAYEALISTPS